MLVLIDHCEYWLPTLGELAASCLEELAPTPYFRHLHDRNVMVCPGKRKIYNVQGGYSEDLLYDLSQHGKPPRKFDSTFELKSSDEKPLT